MNAIDLSESFRLINREAERAVLGCILQNNDALKAIGNLQAGDFYEPLHNCMFGTIRELIECGTRATEFTLYQKLHGTVQLEELGGAKYITGLQGAYTIVAMAPTYAKLVRDCAINRQLNDAMQDDSIDVEALIAELHSDLSARAGDSAGFTAIAKVTDSALRVIQERMNSGQDTGLIASGLTELDREYAPFRAKRIVLLAGRPGMGKTAASLSLAMSMAKNGLKVAFFSLEMPADTLVNRCLSALVYSSGWVPYFKLGRGLLSRAEYERICEAGETLNQLPLYIDASSGLTVQEIRNRVEALRRSVGCDVVFIDYLDKVRPSDRYSGQKVNELGEISLALQGMAKDLDICVVALHQLGRDIEKRPDRRPMLVDLRDSGTLEQDADLVLFVYRECYYLEHKLRHMEAQGSSDATVLQDEIREKRHELEIIVEKNRHGPTGAVKVFCDMGSNVIRDA